MKVDGSNEITNRLGDSCPSGFAPVVFLQKIDSKGDVRNDNGSIGASKIQHDQKGRAPHILWNASSPRADSQDAVRFRTWYSGPVSHHSFCPRGSDDVRLQDVACPEMVREVFRSLRQVGHFR